MRQNAERDLNMSEKESFKMHMQQNMFGDKTTQDVKNDLVKAFEEKQNKERVNDTHTRRTFLVRDDLLERLDLVSEGKRGFKTLLINKALEAVLDEVEA